MWHRKSDDRLTMARFAVEEGTRAIDRQLQHLDSLDLKGSFITAGSAAIFAGLLAGGAAHPPTHFGGRLSSLAAAVSAGVGMVCSLRAWYPRTVEAPPHARGLYMAIGGRELEEREELAERLAEAFERNLEVELLKRTWIKRANLWLTVASAFAVLTFLREFVLR